MKKFKMSVCICYSSISKLLFHKQLNGGIIQCLMSLFIQYSTSEANVCPHARDTLQQIEKKKMYMQFYESSYFLIARKSIRYSQQRQYQKLGIIVYPFTSTIPTFRCLLNNHQRRYRYSARQRSNHLFRQSIGKV